MTLKETADLEGCWQYIGYLEHHLIKGWAYEIEDLTTILQGRYTLKEIRELSDKFQEEIEE